MLAHYEKTLSSEGSENRPPLDSYRTETQEHGEVYIASLEYRDWFRRTYPRASELSDCPRPAPSSPTKRSGESKVSRFKTP